MKKQTVFITLSLFVFLSCLSARAGELYRWNGFVTVFTNSVTTNLATVTGFTNIQSTGQSLDHTFQIFYNVTGTNGGSTLAIDRTIDGANWINVTNWTFSLATTNEELTFRGKWAQYRFRETDLATNGSYTFNYMAQ